MSGADRTERQLLDLEATLLPFAPAVRALDGHLLEALIDDQLSA